MNIIYQYPLIIILTGSFIKLPARVFNVLNNYGYHKMNYLRADWINHPIVFRKLKDSTTK